LKAVSTILAGVLSLGAFQAIGAPVCIDNQSGETLLLVVDDLAGHRITQTTDTGVALCLEASDTLTKTSVGVFASADAEEGCSRLTRPGQRETLIEFTEFDNCKWTPTPRGFSE